MSKKIYIRPNYGSGEEKPYKVTPLEKSMLVNQLDNDLLNALKTSEKDKEKIRLLRSKHGFYYSRNNF